MRSPDVPGVSRARAGFSVVLVMLCGGVLVGGLWAWLAPPVHGVIALAKSGERVRAYLGNESDHFFLAAFLMLGLASVLAVIAAVATWQWRAHRGPAMAVALMSGAAGAAAVACGFGAWLVHLRYGTIDVDGAPVSPEHRVHYVTEAPAVFFGHSPIQIAMTILLPAVAASFVYALLAVAAERDDLGADPPQEPMLRLTADGGIPPVR